MKFQQLIKSLGHLVVIYVVREKNSTVKYVPTQLTASVISHNEFVLVDISPFVSPELQEQELKDHQRDLMMLNTNKSLQPDDTVKNGLTTATGSYGELRRVSHSYLSKSNSALFSPSTQRPR